MEEHNAPFSHIAYQLPDGTTGVLDNHDAQALHDEADSVDAENLASGSVTNGKIAPGAVGEVELADGSVSKAKLSEDVREFVSQTQCPWPVGGLYLSFDATNPAEIWPGTTWTQQIGRFIRMANDTKTGGSDTVTLTIDQIPSHNHTWSGYSVASGGYDFNALIAGRDLAGYTGYSGGSKPHNNMPAYQDVYSWRRTA